MPPSGGTQPDPNVKPISTNDLSVFGQNVATRHSMGLAIQVYPMYENAFRAYRQQTQKQNQDESAKLYSAFDHIACARAHPSSWRSGKDARDAAEIGTVSKQNRMICSPYPLLMNAFNAVNLAAAVIMTSIEHAVNLGIPEDRWIYVLGGAGSDDKENFWERPNFHSSQSLEQSIDGAIAISGLRKEEVDFFDFYSCFPIVPKLACQHLGLWVSKPEKPITVLGGLTSFGGAGNNYSMHAIVEMTRQLRDRKYRNGLILANGGLLTHHHAICLSSQPRKDCIIYPPQPLLLMPSQFPPAPLVDEEAEGDASIETYTLEFDRQGRPQNSYIIGMMLENGHRFLSNHRSWSVQIWNQSDALGRFL